VLAVFSPPLIPWRKEASHLMFSRVSDILSTIWMVASQVPGCGVSGSGFHNLCSVLLVIAELLPGEQSNDVD
jgi:hypothetical protein